MKWYIIKRLLQIIPVILGVTLIAFALIHLAPGDPVRTMLGQHATQQEIEDIRAKYGLDQPLYVQYFIWLGDVLQGDLGRSILSHEQVTTEIASRFPNTIELAIAAMIFAILIGVVAGIISATLSRGLFCDGTGSLWDFHACFLAGDHADDDLRGLSRLASDRRTN
jgi:peptide/nickel transport system permease protein